MRKSDSKLGIISTLLSFVPLTGMVAAAAYSNAHPGAREIPRALFLFAQITTGVAPALGLILGLIGLFKSTKRALSAMGLIFNIGWIIFAIIFYTPEHAPYTKETLPSGRVIKISHIMEVETYYGRPALALEYFTDVDIYDLEKLKIEAEDIWSEFRDNVEQSGYRTAFVCPSEMHEGFFSKTTSFWFCYEQLADGSWILMPYDDGPSQVPVELRAKISRAVEVYPDCYSFKYMRITPAGELVLKLHGNYYFTDGATIRVDRSKVDTAHLFLFSIPERILPHARNTKGKRVQSIILSAHGDESVEYEE